MVSLLLRLKECQSSGDGVGLSHVHLSDGAAGIKEKLIHTGHISEPGAVCIHVYTGSEGVIPTKKIPIKH